MKKIKNLTVKQIIEFRRKTLKNREAFIKKLNKEKVSNESGGDYWISSTSAISRAFKSNNNEEIVRKINDLLTEIERTSYRKTKIMYQRNVEILHNYEDFDLNSLKPSNKIEFQKRPKILEIIEILKLPVRITPSHVYTYEKDGLKFVGGLWIACKLNGFSINELASYTEGLYKYLQKNYSNKYLIDKEYCIALDAFTGRYISYCEIESGLYTTISNSTIPLIKEAI